MNQSSLLKENRKKIETCIFIDFFSILQNQRLGLAEPDLRGQIALQTLATPPLPLLGQTLKTVQKENNKNKEKNDVFQPL